MTRVYQGILTLALSVSSAGWSQASTLSAAAGGPADRGPRPQLGTPDAAVRPEWAFAQSGWASSAAGFDVADLTGVGERRIVAATPWNYWCLLRYEGGGYVQDWVSERFPETIDSLRVANVDGDPAQEILVATKDRILVYQGAPPVLEREIHSPGVEIRALTVADLDGDGARELVFGAAPYDFEDRSTLYVLDYATGAIEFAGPGLGGVDLAVGNVDGDPALEIVVASGTGFPGAVLPGYVIDGATHLVEWTNPIGFGDLIRLGDIDGDGALEAVAAWEWNGIRVFEFGTRSLSASINVDLDLGALRVADVEGDGPLEILYGDGQWGAIHVINGQTRLEKWKVDNPGWSPNQIVVADTDGDGSAEVLWGNYQGRLYVADARSRAIEWESASIHGPFSLSSGDVDGDGAVDILSASASSDAGGPLWSLHHGNTHRLEFRSGPISSAWGTRGTIVRNANVDGDAAQEVFLSEGQDPYGGALRCYDGSTHIEQWRVSAPASGVFASFDLGDVDGDGQLEVVAMGGNTLYVYDARTGVLEWQGPPLPRLYGVFSLLQIANVDADPQPEVLLANPNADGTLYIVDALARTTESRSFPPFTALAAFDPDGDGRADVLLGDPKGNIRQAAADGTGVRVLAALGEPAVSAIAVGDLDGLPGLEFVVARTPASSYGANEMSIHGRDGSLLWRSGPIEPAVSIGGPGGLHLADVDGDGRTEILVNVGYGFRVYEVVSLPQTTASVNDVAMNEGNTGTTVARFTVALSGPGPLPVKIKYATQAGTAAAGSDFVATSGTLSFDPGTTLRTVDVPIVGDRLGEYDETFELRLSEAEYARVLDGSGLATIVNDDPPGLYVSDVLVREPESGVATASFAVTLVPAWPAEVRVDYATTDGTARASEDYLAVSGSLVFAPGEVAKTVSVTVNTDEEREPGETFALDLTRPVTAEVVDGSGVARIVDRDVLLFFTLPPCRLYDSRTATALAAGANVSVQAWSRCGVPEGTKALALNVTVTQPSTAGHLTVTAEDSLAATTSTLNFGAGRTRANSAVVSVGASGLLKVTSGQVTGSTHFILDVTGYFR